MKKWYNRGSVFCVYCLVKQLKYLKKLIFYYVGGIMARWKSIVFLFCVFVLSVEISSMESFGENVKWVNIYEEISGRVLFVHGKERSNEIYAGTETGLYEKKDIKLPWVKIEIGRGVLGFEDIVVLRKGIYVLAEGGVYYKLADNGKWEYLTGLDDIKGIEVYTNTDSVISVIAWSDDSLYIIDGTDVRKTVISHTIKGSISGAVCSKGNIFVVAGGDLFLISVNDSSRNKKINILRKDHLGESMYEETETDEPQVKRLITDIDVCSDGTVVIATVDGMYKLLPPYKTATKMTGTGMPDKEMKYVACIEDKIFVSNGYAIYYLSHNPGDNKWVKIFEVSHKNSIASLNVSKDNTGRTRVLTSTGYDVFFRYDNSRIKKVYSGENNVQNSYAENVEPTIKEVHHMAIEYAEVSPQKIKRWRDNVKWKAVMPRVSVGYSQSDDAKSEIYTSGSTSYVYEGPREIDNDWNVDLIWELSDLIWNDSETSIDVRSKLMVQLRDDILEEVTRLYFERKRVMKEIKRLQFHEADSNNDNEGKKKYYGGEDFNIKLDDKRLHLEELTAHIDALTGGKFSEMIE